jgi:hypothetical protein
MVKAARAAGDACLATAGCGVFITFWTLQLLLIPAVLLALWAFPDLHRYDFWGW